MVGILLLDAVATAVANPVGLNGAGNKSLALSECVATAFCDGVGVKLEREPEWASEITSWTWLSQISAGSRIQTNRGTGMTRITIREGESVTIRSRCKDPDGELLFAASVATILVQVFDTTAKDRTIPVYQKNLVVADTMYSALQIDKGWRTGSAGYASKLVVPGQAFKEGGRLYRVEMIYTRYDGEPVTDVHEVETAALWSSRAHVGG